MTIRVYDIRHPGPAYEGVAECDLPISKAEECADDLLAHLKAALDALRRLRSAIWDERLVEYNENVLADLISDAEYMQELARKREFY